MPWLINAAQLDKFKKSQKSLIILDATWHLPATGRNARYEFMNKHIVDAYFFDINDFSDPNTDLPNMLPQDETFINQKLSALGIRNDCKIIFYDNSDCHSACRALWMFKMFGHNPHLLYILDGGLTAWESYQGKIDVGDPAISPKKYTAQLQTDFVRTLAQMKANEQHPTEQVVDVRHPVRFCGGPETRPNMRSGHIPGGFSFPYFTMFSKEGAFLSLEKIQKKLVDVGIDLKSPIVSMCGSAITACVLDFVLDIMGHTQHAVYDGSWSEWGSEKLYSGETSLAERPIETCVD